MRRLRGLKHVVPFVLLGMSAACATLPPDSTGLLSVKRAADQAYAQGDLARAGVDYQKLAQAMPEDAWVWFRLGNIAARQGHPNTAVKNYQAALIRDPKLAPAWHNLAIVRLRQAQSALIAAVRLSPSDSALSQMSWQLAQGLEQLPGVAGETPTATAQESTP